MQKQIWNFRIELRCLCPNPWDFPLEFSISDYSHRFVEEKLRGIFRTVHQLKNCSCQRCSCCLNFKWRPLWEIFLSFCISYILSRFLLVVWGLIFWPATSFHGLISLNMVRVVRETAKKQREQTRLIFHCKEPILCWLHLKELADMCTSFTLWSLYSFLSNTVGNSSVNKNHSFTDVSSGDQLKLSKWTNTRNVENDPGIIMLLWPNLWEILCVHAFEILSTSAKGHLFALHWNKASLESISSKGWGDWKDVLGFGIMQSWESQIAKLYSLLTLTGIMEACHKIRILLKKDYEMRKTRWFILYLIDRVWLGSHGVSNPRKENQVKFFRRRWIRSDCQNMFFSWFDRQNKAPAHFLSFAQGHCQCCGQLCHAGHVLQLIFCHLFDP